MRSIAFPEMFTRTTTNLTGDYYATLQNLKLLLQSNKGELFGDPYFGTNLKKYIYEQNDSILADILIDDIYTAVAEFMPQLYVNRNDITVTADRGSVIILISALNRVSFQTDLYQIVLLENNV